MLLRREGRVVNHKRIYRIYRQEGLTVRRKKRKRVARGRGPMLLPPMRTNQRWSMDFMGDTSLQAVRFVCSTSSTISAVNAS